MVLLTSLVVATLAGLPQVVPQEAPAEPTRCRIISAIRADKVGAGAGTYTARDPSKVSGVVALVEFSHAGAVQLRSAFLSLQYMDAGRAKMARVHGFDMTPTEEDVAKDATWSMPLGNYKIPLNDPGPDGIKGTERIRLLFLLPSHVDSGTLFYVGGPCGEPAKLPARASAPSER